MFIAFDGPDGSGKGEQTKLLVERLIKSGVSVATFDFPQYTESFFGRIVGDMLANRYGDMNAIDPHLTSLPYSFDRWKATPSIKKSQEEGRIVVANRFTLANLAHQTARVEPSKREEFVKFITDLEWNELEIPQPDIYVYLDVPSEISKELIYKKAKREYLEGAKVDALEINLNHQLEAAKLYREFAKRKDLFENIIHIHCCDISGKLRSIENIHGMIWSEVMYQLIGQTKEGTPRRTERR
jgi:dTMP kinase